MFNLWKVTSFEEYLNTWPSIANKFDKLTNYQKSLGYTSPEDFFTKNAFAAQEIANERIGNILERIFSTIDLAPKIQDHLKKFTYKAIDFIRMNDIVIFQQTRTNETSLNNGRTDSSSRDISSIEGLVGQSAWRSWLGASLETLYIRYCEENKIPFLLDPEQFYNKTEINNLLSKIDERIDYEHSYTDFSIKTLKENQKLFSQETDEAGNVVGEVKNLGWFENLLIRSRRPDNYISDKFGEKTAVINLNEQIGELIEAVVYQSTDENDDINAIGRIWGSQIEQKINDIFLPGEIKTIEAQKKRFYSYDSTNKKIVSFDLDGNWTELFDYIPNISYRYGFFKEQDMFYIVEGGKPTNGKINSVDLNGNKNELINVSTLFPRGLIKEGNLFYSLVPDGLKASWLVSFDFSRNKTNLVLLNEIQPFQNENWLIKEEDTFYIVDKLTKKLRSVDLSGKINTLLEFDFPPSGIFKDGDLFYTIDTSSNKLVSFDLSGKINILYNFTNEMKWIFFEYVPLELKNWIKISQKTIENKLFFIYQYQPPGFNSTVNFKIPYFESQQFIKQQEIENAIAQEKVVLKKDLKIIENEINSIKPTVQELKEKEDFRIKKLGLDPNNQYWKEGDENE